jgi:aspartate aminotransferase
VKDHERISSRLSKFRPSLTLALKELVAGRVERGLPVYDFGLGETKGHLNDPIRAAGERAFREEDTMYADPAGLPELRQAVLRWLALEEHYSVDNVVINTGAKQGLFNIFLSICNPADAVLFEAAPWVSYQPLATAAYGFPVMVLPRAGRDGLLKVTQTDLERNLDLRPHAKLFLLNNPVNPTSQLYEAEEIEALLRVCVDHRIYFVLDRLYWKLIFDGRRYPEPRIDAETRPWLIQIDGMSKNFRRTGGLRIGWTIAPDDVAAAMINLQSHYTAGPAVPTQRAALAALEHPYDVTMVEELQAKRDLLHEVAASMPHVDIWPTPAAFYSFWDVRGTFGKTTPEGRTLRNSNDVAEYLAVSGGVVTASGSGFAQDGYLRLSFATPDKTIIDGMKAARSAFEVLR